MVRKKIDRILMFAVLIGLLIVPATYAIFRGTVNSSLALTSSEWDVSLNQNNDNNYLTIVPEPENVNDTYTLHMTSNSEVDVIYSIIIDNVPTGVSVKAGNGSFVQESNHKVLLNNAGVIHYNPNGSTEDCVLTFKASSGATFVDEQQVSISVILSQEVPS